MRGDDPSDMEYVQGRHEVFPACAGMIPSLANLMTGSESVPRMRGDDPPIIYTMDSGYWCSPHARG